MQKERRKLVLCLEGVVMKIADERMGFGIRNVKRQGNVAKNREHE